MWRKRKHGLLVLVVVLALVAPLPSTVAAAPALTVSAQMVTHLAGCVDRSQVMRGDQVVWLIKVTNAAGQEISSGLDVTVNVGKFQLKSLGYVPTQKAWVVPFPITWDMPRGNMAWFITVKTPQGEAVEWKPPSYLTSRFLTIIPGPLKVTAQAVDPASGAAWTEARAGTSVRIMASISRPAKGDLYPYSTAARELTGIGLTETKGAPVTQNVTVKAIIGQGSFVRGTQSFSGGVLSTVPVTYDPASQSWRASLKIAAGAAPGEYSVAVMAVDKFDNTGVGLIALKVRR